MSHHDVRHRLEAREETLSPFAAKSRLALRDRFEEPCSIRTEFQRDRDRIIHSKSFRRLKHKTQVFIAPLGDHYVTRLTHTLEASQIARTIARALNLNEDLAEAISLGHDLGHTPFGHVGEEVLNEIYHEGFSHNEQSLRVVEVLENEGRGLNLTWDVREGILNHSKAREDIFMGGWAPPRTVEGQICKMADMIAYINHDIGDAIRAGLITTEDLPRSTITVLGRNHSERINTLVNDIVGCSWAVTGFEDSSQTSTLSMSPQTLKAVTALRDFLFDRVYKVRVAKGETERAQETVRLLYRHFTEHPNDLPEEFLKSEDGVERWVVDYIAGMTDQFALRMAAEVLR